MNYYDKQVVVRETVQFTRLCFVCRTHVYMCQCNRAMDKSDNHLSVQKTLLRYYDYGKKKWVFRKPLKFL